MIINKDLTYNSIYSIIIYNEIFEDSYDVVCEYVRSVLHIHKHKTILLYKLEFSQMLSIFHDLQQQAKYI